MTIKELEDKLNTPRATIRFYEKEKLICPDRGMNNYRNYTEADLAALKKVVLFRKLGISIEDIRDVLAGTKGLEAVVSGNISALQNQILELEGAIRLSRYICQRGESIESFDEEYYWNLVLEEERRGNKFVDLAKDIAQFQKKIILDEFGLAGADGNLICSPGKAIARALLLCTALGIVLMCLGRNFTIAGFLEGFTWPLTMILMATCFGLPVFLIGRKYPKLAMRLKKIGNVLAVLITIFLLTLVAYDFIWGI